MTLEETLETERKERLRKAVGSRTYDTLFNEEGKYCPTHETNFLDMINMTLDTFDSIKNGYKKAVDYIRKKWK